MLSKEDKKWIAEAISKIKNNKGSNDDNLISSKPSITDIKELIRKRQQNAETLEERIELEKYELKRKLTKPIRDAQVKLNQMKKDAAKKLVPNQDARKVIGIGAKSISSAAKSVVGGAAAAAGTLGGAAVSGTIGAVKNTVNAVKNSRLGSSAVEALMYSNPITAAIYMNKDLMRGLTGGVKGFISGTKSILGTGIKAAKQLGGGLWEGTKALGKGVFDTASYFYGKGKNKYQPPQKQIPGKNLPALVDSEKQISQNNVKLFIARDGTNYILTKTAIFMGGQNYLNVTAKPSKPSAGFLPAPKSGIISPKGPFGLLPGPTAPAGLLPGPVKLLPKKREKDDDVIEMTKGINGIYEQTKKSNKLLDKLGKKQVLIALGVLAAVAGIAGLAILIQKLVQSKIPKPTKKPKLTEQIKTFEDQSKISSTDAERDINQAIQNMKPVGEPEKVNKIISAGADSGLLKKAGVAVYNTISEGRKQSGYSVQAQEGDPYFAPFNMKILRWEINDRKLGVINIVAEKIVPRGINKNITITNVYRPTKWTIPYNERPKDMPKITQKGDLLGYVGPTGKIFIKDITNEDMNSYVKMINDIANNTNKPEFKVSTEDQELVNKTIQKTLVKPIKQEINRQSRETEYKQLTPTQQRMLEQGYRLDDIKSSEVKPAKVPTSDKYNVGNKNTEKAKQQTQKSQQESQPKKEEKPVTKAQTVQPRKIAYHEQPKPQNRYFAPKESTDFAAMYADRFGISTV